MKKIKDKKKFRRTIFLYFLITVLSFFGYLYVNLYVHARIITLEIDIQDQQRQIETIKQENLKLIAEIGELTSKERIFKIADEQGLSINYGNVIAIENKDVSND